MPPLRASNSATTSVRITRGTDTKLTIHLVSNVLLIYLPVALKQTIEQVSRRVENV